MNNIALNRRATQSSTSFWSTNPDVEVDARIANNGDLVSSRWFHTDREFRPWWQIDLEGLFLIERIVIYNRFDYRDRLKHFTMLRSHDGNDWFEFFKKADDTAFDVFPVNIATDCLARFVRLRLDGCDFLHFREIQIFGKPADQDRREHLSAEDALILQKRRALPEGRKGHLAEIDGFYIFVDEDNYPDKVRHALDMGYYENRERSLVPEFILPSDRVIEVGTAVGIVAMIAASVVGPTNVVTFDANPDIVADARENFRRNGLQEIKSKVGALACRRNFKDNDQIDFYIAKEFWGSRLNARLDHPDIIKSIKTPVMCLEQEIASHNANVLICDIEGGEVNLLRGAHLSGIRLIILETHYWAAGEAATDAMIRELILQGFSLHLGSSGNHVSVLRRS